MKKIIALTYIALCLNLSAQNNALQFDGLNDNVVINNNPSLDFSINNSFSIEAWFNTASSLDGEIFSKMANSFPYTGYELFIRNGGTLSFLLNSTWTSNTLWVTTVNTFNDGLWHHATVVYNGTGNANNVILYVDGVAQAKTILNNSLSTAVNNTTNAGIGARNNNGYFFNGKLDEVRVWNRALCAAEVNTHKNCNLMGNETGLVAYYNFNQGVANSNNATITNLTDLTVNNNIGVLTGFALSGATSNWTSSSAVISGTCSPVGPISVSGNTIICVGNTSTLTASGGGSYTWTPGNTNSTTIAVSPTTTSNYTVVGTNTLIGCLNNTISVSVAVNLCTGIQNSNLIDLITIYPNPSNGNFKILSGEKDGAIKSIEIQNTLGVTIQTIAESGSSVEINIQDQPTGLYLVKLNYADKVITKKVVKQ